MKKDYSDATDAEIVELSKTNPDVFEEIVIRYQDRLFYYVRRISYFDKEDTEDILQEVFIKVYKNLNGFDQSMKFSTWIYQITHNTVIDAIRKKQARPQGANLEDEELLKIFKSGIDVEKEAIGNDQLEKIKEIINDLPLKYREVLVLRFLEEKSYEEIMDIIKKPKGTVAALINRGRKLVLKEMEKQELISR